MDIRRNLELNYRVYKEFEDILNSYVSDYYLEDHWNKLPKSWQEHFTNITCEQLSELLDFSTKTTSLKYKLYPLSMLCLRELIIRNTLPRNETVVLSSASAFEGSEDFMNFFWKNVKLKKRHEITRLAQKCFESAEKTDCYYIVDIGSGLGHLSRMMAFGYGLKVCTFEANEVLSQQAGQLDKDFDSKLRKRNIRHKRKYETVHLSRKITADFEIDTFLKLVATAFGCDENLRFGVVGLHPCGDLGSTLLKLYVKCPKIVFINMASCCYMKITLNPFHLAGFPLSRFGSNMKMNLSYLSCEIACHSIENYADKLKNPEEYNKLKIHAYRALLEKILVSIDPKLGHSMVCGIKYKEGLTFRKYVEKVLGKMNIIPPENLVSICENTINKTWKKVIVFYSLRLLLAPLVETIILNDRLLHVKENGSNCEIVSLFDCIISPRNQMIIAMKIKNK
ncbi:hypothetical protein JTB14_005614 [Gonioctena quinquepunctata]|nr:hypothetical protein JTB14_005614 [Gonioctena quinquepunctata]